MRVIGYTRLSRLSERSTSIQRQRESIEQYAAARGWTLVGIEEEEGVSATSTKLDDRPGLRRIRAAVAEGHAEAVVVYRLDRLVRSVIDVSRLLDEGLQVVSTTESFDTTSSTGRALVQVAAIFAELEAGNIRARVSSAHALARREGRWNHGAAPYGFRRVRPASGKGWTLAVEADEAAIVRRMADAVLSGASCYAVGDRLNDEAVTTRRGARWNATNVRRVLRSPTIAGYVPHEGEPFRDEHGLPVVGWTPLVDAEEWGRILDATAWAADGQEQRRPSARLLSGRLRCPTCAARMVVRAYRDERVPPVYVCGTTTTRGVCARRVVVQADRADETAASKFLDQAGRFRVKRLRRTDAPPAELDAVERAIEETTAALGVRGADRTGLLERLDWLDAERDRLDALPRESTWEEIDGGQTFAEAWEGATLEERRSLLDLTGARFEVVAQPSNGRWNPDRIRMTLDHDPNGEPSRATAEDFGEGESSGPSHGSRRLPRTHREP